MPSVPLHHRIFGRLHLIQISKVPNACIEAPYGYFQIGQDAFQPNYRDPDGPPNLLILHSFCDLVDLQILQNAHRSTALCVDQSASSRTQAAFLLGGYMIMRHDLSPDEALHRLAPALDSGAGVFHDVLEYGSFSRLDLRDCLVALHRSRGLGWIKFSASNDLTGSDIENGGFDPAEYAYFDSPLNADLHELIAGRLLVSSCPRILPDGAAWADRHDAAGSFVARDFSPAFAAEHLAQFDVALCVRVGIPRYGRDDLDGTGLDLLDLYCEERLDPDPAAVDRFLAAVDGAAPCAVVVQGDGRRGPASALVGAYLVRRHGFTGREAAAWLRMVRPGCVSAAHVRFLCGQEGLALGASEAGPCCCSAAAGDKPATCRRQSTDAAVPSLQAGDKFDSDSDGAAVSVLPRSGSTGQLAGLLSWVGRWGL
jgi:hypothetical protein